MAVNPAQTPIGYALTAIALAYVVVCLVVVCLVVVTRAQRPPG